MTEVLTYEALKAERDALAQRVEMLAQNLGNAIWGDQEALQRVNALAVENVEMRGVIDAAIGVANNSSGIAGWHLNGEIADWDEILPELNIETPATDAALAAIQAQGVEMFADSEHCSQEAHSCAHRYLAALREAK